MDIHLTTDAEPIILPIMAVVADIMVVEVAIITTTGDIMTITMVVIMTTIMVLVRPAIQVHRPEPLLNNQESSGPMSSIRIVMSRLIMIVPPDFLNRAPREDLLPQVHQ